VSANTTGLFYVASWLFILLALTTTAYGGLEISKGRIAAAPMVLVALMLLAAAMAWTGILYSEFALFWSRRGAQRFGFQNCLYMAVILLAYLATYWVAARGSKTKQSTDFLLAAAPRSIGIVALAIFVFVIIQISLTDFDVLWSNSEYLLIGSSRAVSDPNSLFAFVFRFSKFVAVLAFALFAFSIIQRQRFTFWLLLPACIWFMTVALAGHSRNSVVFATVTAAVLALFFAAMAVANLSNSLSGRSSGTHGVEALGSYLSYTSEIGVEDAGRFFTNLFEGAYSQGEVFYYAGIQHNEMYKLLSFSPLPSFLDGFDAILNTEIRFHYYVPMGATGEVLLFGPGYTAAYFAVVLLAYYAVTKAFLRRQSYVTLGILCLFILASHVQFAYPTRWGFRIFLFCIVAAYLSRFKLRWSARESTGLSPALNARRPGSV
jgi:hypothetical protein